MKQKNSNILKINPWRIIRIFIITFLLLEIIFYLTFQGSSNQVFWPLDNSFYYYTPALIVATIIFCVISITQTSYEIEGTKLIHNKMGKITEYYWNDIIYINKEFSERKKMMLFYTKDGLEHELAFDKEGKIYKVAIEKCRLISDEEFVARFSNKTMRKH